MPSPVNCIAKLSIYQIRQGEKGLKNYFVDFLRQKTAKKQQHKDTRAYGILKDKIRMTPDFDEPLDDFKAYM